MCHAQGITAIKLYSKIYCKYRKTETGNYELNNDFKSEMSAQLFSKQGLKKESK